MKRALLFSIVFLFRLSSMAQVINSLHIVPVIPTVNDNITIYADVSFPSGTCDQKTQSFYINGTTIYANAIHCLGPLAYICNHTDTFPIGQLQAGIYQFVYSVDYGMQPAPCTPGIVAGPVDTLVFYVDGPAGIGENTKTEFHAHLKNDLLIITPANENQYELNVYDAMGRLCISRTSAGYSEIPFAGMNEGLYIISFRQKDAASNQKVIYNP